MIRRTEGDNFLLIRQHDHAILAGEIGKHWGNGQFERPARFDELILGISNHDLGWQKMDDLGLLSKAGYPLDVFESPRNISHGAWLESARSATKLNLYAGLLVSLHQLGLSAISVSGNQPSRFDVQQLKQQFDLNKFQHAIIEHAEHIRQKLGMPVDRPLRLGLADGWSDEHEELLKKNLRILQAMDLLSLSICCNIPPESKTVPIPDQPGGQGIGLQLNRPDPTTLLVSPWPFDVAEFAVQVQGRLVPKKKYESSQELLHIIQQSETMRLDVKVRGG